MTVEKTFPWKTGCVVIMAAIGALLTYDVRKNGTFEGSSTGRFLRDVGATEIAEQTWNNAISFSNKSYEWAQSNIPEYHAMAIETLEPVVQLCRDKGVIAADYLSILFENMKYYIEESAPVITSWVNHYAPGLLETLKQYSSLIYEAFFYYFAILWNYFLEYSYLGIKWMQNNVFIGSLSPDNIQRYSMEAFNTTQIYALWTYDWVCQKVQTLSKIQ